MGGSDVKLIVAGAPGVASVLKASGRFADVLSVAATSELRDVIAGGVLASADPKNTVFVFSDATRDDTPGAGLSKIVERLCASNWKVIIVASSPSARELVGHSPSAGMVMPPFTANNMIGAISSACERLLDPVEDSWGFVNIDPFDPDAHGTAVSRRGEVPEGWNPAGTSRNDHASSSDEVVSSGSAAGVAPVGTVSVSSASPQVEAPVAEHVATPEEMFGGRLEVDDVHELRPAAGPGGWSTVEGAEGFSSDVVVPQPSDVEPVAAPQPDPTPFSTDWVSAQTAVSEPAVQPAVSEPAAQPAWSDVVVPQPSDVEPVAAPQPDPTPFSTDWVSTVAAEPTPAANPSTSESSAASEPSPFSTDWTTATGTASNWSDAVTPADPLHDHAPAPERPHLVDSSSTSPFGTDWTSAVSETPPNSQQPPSNPWGDSSPYWQQTATARPQTLTTQAFPGARNGKVIPICVAKGGAGKSTLTLNLGVFAALALRETGKKVCVVDANFQQADIGNLISSYTPNISTLAGNPADLNPERINRHVVFRPDLNCAFLLGPALTEDANPMFITPELYTSAIQSLRMLYDYIFVDTPVAEFHHTLFSDFVIPQADFMIVPINPDFRAINNADRWLRDITRPVLQGGNGFDPLKAGFVLNKASDAVGCTEEQARVEMGTWRYLGPIPSTDLWQRAANEEEVIAALNYQELNAAFARILAGATGEETFERLTESNGAVADRRKGLIGRLFGR